MTAKEAMANLKMISVAFVEPVTKEQRELIDDTFDMASKALEIEPCDDAVSRQAVLETLDDMDNVLDEDRTIENYKELLKECYEVLPPVTPQQKMGHWIASHIPESILDECSECGFSCGSFTFNYCPMCGVKMFEPQEG